MKYLTRQQTESLFNGLDSKSKFFKRNEALVRLVVNTGLRISEATGLNVGDVLNNRGEIRDEMVVRKEIAKNSKERMVPLNDKAKKAICVIMEFNDSETYVINSKSPLIISRKHCRITPRQVQRIVEDARNRADLDVKVTPHTLRHTFAKANYEHKNNIKAVQQLLGHSYLSSTQIYTEVSKKELRDQVNSVSF